MANVQSFGENISTENTLFYLIKLPAEVWRDL